MEEFKPNSYKSKEDANQLNKEITKVANGKVRKKSAFSKFMANFISDDASSVKSYILMDVIIPALKKAISDSVSNGIDILLYGEGDYSRKSKTYGTKVSYRNYYDNGGSQRRDTTRTREVCDYDNIIFEKRVEAEEVLTRMDELIDQYGMASVADLFEFSNLTGPYTGNRYGWTDIHSAYVVQVRDGYMIKLPRALPLN